ncbi:hypothetical protein L1987_11216 [Smallanthus sonchifolius]|uniref:Uncharacterized protein n=1 Tax=Smallanthus sonchifolius TaxID=185202 RepID=A0ACB9JCK3_9ASTR|nr:hypothetical protein L1987_11216 [Smallanthus sonchifolius]
MGLNRRASKQLLVSVEVGSAGEVVSCFLIEKATNNTSGYLFALLKRLIATQIINGFAEMQDHVISVIVPKHAPVPIEVYVKLSALFRVSRRPFPYEDLSPLLSQILNDFPFVVEECGYKEAKVAVSKIANQVPISPSDLEWIMGGTAMQLFKGQWTAS